MDFLLLYLQALLRLFGRTNTATAVKLLENVEYALIAPRVLHAVNHAQYTRPMAL